VWDAEEIRERKESGEFFPGLLTKMKRRTSKASWAEIQEFSKRILGLFWPDYEDEIAARITRPDEFSNPQSAKRAPRQQGCRQSIGRESKSYRRFVKSLLAQRTYDRKSEETFARYLSAGQFRKRRPRLGKQNCRVSSKKKGLVNVVGVTEE